MHDMSNILKRELKDEYSHNDVPKGSVEKYQSVKKEVFL